LKAYGFGVARKLRIAGAALALIVVTIVPAACGRQEGEGSYGGRHPDYARALAGAPAPLAALHAEANQLLPGGTAAFRRRLAALRGYPVVVNKWASWCGPCRAEFPFFQRQAAKLGKRVAFLGVDSGDSDGSAKTFLREFPVPYPSYTDPGEKIAGLMRATIGFPTTTFYDRRGRIAYTHAGGYPSQAALAADMARYAR
jgi:cytochrome c biogenesis protein CcmG, thiol:disulfide interchange protein DsbE